MPDYQRSKSIEPDSQSPSGNIPISFQMFGNAGALAPGKSNWSRLHGCHWKSFMLRAAASPFSGGLGACSVEIHVANELDPVNADADTKFKVLATLTTASSFLELEQPYRFVRAELKVAGTVACQVDFHGIAV